jgi:small subunit ribosomal protein S3
MGQKVHPRGLRTGILYGWESRWFPGKDSARFLGEDSRVRRFVKSRLQSAGISRVEIERAAERIKVNIYAAKPGLVIGKKGKDIEDLKKDLCNLVKRGKDKVAINIVESRKAEMDAQLLAESVAFQLERRVNFRRAVKDASNKALRMGAEGVKVCVGGRLNGADIARTEMHKEGRVPLHTLRADIDYGTAEAHTTYGIIGIKAWVFKGERFSSREQGSIEAMQL